MVQWRMVQELCFKGISLATPLILSAREGAPDHPFPVCIQKLAGLRMTGYYFWPSGCLSKSLSSNYPLPSRYGSFIH